MTEEQNASPSVDSEMNDYAEVEFNPGLKLDDQYKQLLKELLGKAYQTADDAGQKVVVQNEFGFGKSGARSFLIRYGQRPQAVAKVDHPYHLRKEERAYAKFVRNVLPAQHRVELSGELIESDNSELGLIIYNFLRDNGSDANDKDLLGYYRKEKSGKKVAEYLDRLHNSTMAFRQNITYQTYPYDLEYDRLMPVHFELQYAGKGSGTSASGNRLHLHSGTIDWSQISDIKVGQALELEAFEVTDKRGGILRVRGDSPRDERSTHLRAKLAGVEYDKYTLGDRSALDHVQAQVIRTREQLLELEASVAAVHFADDKQTFTVGKKHHQNPIHVVRDYLGAHQKEVRYSIIHGDLNLRNIMIAADSVWLIDFADTRVGPTLLDYQRLEDHVIGEILAPAMRDAGLSPNTLVDLYNVLHEDLDRPNPPFRLRKLREPHYILQKIRQMARESLRDKSDWTEYYRGLFLVSLGALKYDTRDPFARALSLIGAATARHYVEKNTIYVPKPKGPIMSRLTMAIVAITLILLGVAIREATLRIRIDPPSPPLATTSTATPTIVPTPRSTVLPTTNTTPPSANITPTLHITTLQRVKDRGYLRCGISGTLPRFSEAAASEDNTFINESDIAKEFYSNAVGFDADYCRVMAVAIFGQYRDKVAFLDLVTEKDPQNPAALERFDAVVNGDVDVAFRNTTITSLREELVDFGPPIYIDSMKFMFRLDKLYTEDEAENEREQLLERLKTTASTVQEIKQQLAGNDDGNKICVLEGTTTMQALLMRYQFDEQQLLTRDQEGRKLTNETIVREIQARHCKVMASDESQLQGHLLKDNEIEARDYGIFPSEDVMTFEPLAPFVAEGDNEWLDIVKRVVWITMQADLLGLHGTEEIQVGDANLQRAWQVLDNINASEAALREATELLANSNPFYSADEYWLFLALDKESDVASLADGLFKRYPFKIVSQMGNYSDLFHKHMGEAPYGRNKVYNPFEQSALENTGLLLAPPVGIPSTKVDGGLQ